MQNSNRMKTKNKILYVALALCFIAAVVFSIPEIRLLPDERANVLLTGALSRACFTAFFICLLFLFGQTYLLHFPRKSFPKALLWSIPCFLVAIVNFPFSALITGSATVERAELIPLFALLCVCIGLSEELTFRGIVHDFIKRKLAGKKNGYIFSVLISSAVFGLWHLLNLAYGAGVGATFLQVGYSFLIGAMLAVTYDKTRNIWLCAFIHALFDFGGMLVDYLGRGNVHDLVFWILTAVFGVMCAVHIIVNALKLNKKPYLIMML